MKRKDNADNLGHNILRLFDILPNFYFATSKTKRDYQHEIWYIRVATRAAKQLEIEEFK